MLWLLPEPEDESARSGGDNRVNQRSGGREDTDETWANVMTISASVLFWLFWLF